jgi:hypothetical protein
MVEATIPAAERAAITPEQRRKLFWAEDRPELSPLMQEILTQYSKIPENETVSHVEELVGTSSPICIAPQLLSYVAGSSEPLRALYDPLPRF